MDKVEEDRLEESVGTAQAEILALRQIVKVLLAQHGLSKSPDDPTVAIDALAELLLPAFSQPEGAIERWQNGVSRDLILDQIEGAKMILRTFRNTD